MKVMVTANKAAGRRFKVLLEWEADEQVWITYVPTLGQLSTYGDTRDEALEQTREAILGYLEAAVKEGIPIPRADTETEIVDLEVAAP
jgi:predicted RNase H-like HicB family nuclease